MHHVSLLFLSALQLLFDMDKEVFPMVVQAVVDEGEGEPTSGNHTLICVFVSCWRGRPFVTADRRCGAKEQQQNFNQTRLSFHPSAQNISATLTYCWLHLKRYSLHCSLRRIASVYNLWSLNLWYYSNDITITQLISDFMWKLFSKASNPNFPSGHCIRFITALWSLKNEHLRAVCAWIPDTFGHKVQFMKGNWL